MGQASSSLSTSEALSYARRAELGKKIPDEILKYFFENADFLDLLSLANIENCPAYIFSTATQLKDLFQKIQVAPKLGAKGEIYYLPVSKVAPPSYTQTKNSSPAKSEQILVRDVMCMEVAYIYVRIFQIWSALALTVLDANPARAGLRTIPRTPGKPQQAVFYGGSRGQKGGSMQGSGATLKYTKQAENSLWAPLKNYFRWEKENNIYLYFEDSNKTAPGKLYIQWIDPMPQTTATLNCFYISGSIEIPETINISYLNNNEKAILTFGKSNSVFLEFNKSRLGGWTATSLEDGSLTLHKYFEDLLKEAKELQQAKQERPGVVSSTSVKRLQGVSGGASVFDNFDDIKKLFEQRSKGKEIPKAYAIARAMTLLNPVFSSEKDKQQPFYSQICSAKYDFEIEDFMPRLSKRPNANIYFRSLVSLFFDDFTVKNGEVTFTQTETGRSDLQTASQRMARLYAIEGDKKDFLMSSSEFRDFPGCQKHRGLIQIIDPNFANILYTTSVKPLLDLQEEHTKKVNELLKEMFDLHGGTMKFSPAIRNGGRPAVNAFGNKAKKLLLDYYIKSEALFIRGVLLFEQKQFQGSFALTS